MTFYTCIVILLLYIARIECQNGARVDVNTSRGPLFGFRMDQGNDSTHLYHGQADVFYGIPYVQAPIGLLRYEKPRRLDKFPGAMPYNATEAPLACPQPGRNSTQSSEDCLYLNIFTPNAHAAPNTYAVMIFIHGGGFEVGDINMNPGGIIRNFNNRGVIVINIAYRLGFLGFFTTFTDEFPPNLGMLDQVESFKFVQEEVAHFGGDPNKVTIFGESAGAASVSAHSYSPLSQNLFQQGIQESGTVLTCFEGALGPTNRNFLFAQKACNYTVGMWDSGNFGPLKSCMMNLTIEDGINYHNEINGRLPNAVCWNMVQDNYFFPGTPQDLYRNRTNKPMIIGTNKDEWALFEANYLSHNHLENYTKTNTETRLAANYANYLGNHTRIALDLYENIYLCPIVGDNDYLTFLQYMINVGTSLFFTGFAAQDITYHLVNNNTNIYTYEFTYYTPDFHPFNIMNISGFYPVPHMAEIPFIFTSGAILSGADNETNVKIADFFGETWTNFAKFGTPTLDNSWKTTTSKFNKMEYMEINSNPSMKTGYRVLDQAQYNKIMPIFLGALPLEKPDYNNGSIV